MIVARPLRLLVPALAALLVVVLAFSRPLPAENEDPGEAVYHAPEGTAPPVAPPLKKGSPLDHLANDPKLDQPNPGYREGHTTGPAGFVGHRFLDDQGGSGWGWVKKAGDDGWGDAKWVALQEMPGLVMAPFRRLVKHENDKDWEYRFWGAFVKYKAYDPHLDEQLPVFVLQGYEVIGPANPLKLRVGAPGRPQHRGSGASSRESSPILSNPGVD